MPKTYAAIDLGANSIRLTIFEPGDDQNYRVLESLSQPLRLGKDTFVNSVIHRDHFRDALEILNGFKKVMGEYDVSKTIAVATSAVREAKNRLDFTDFLANQTGIEFTILEDTEETRLTFLALQAELGEDSKYFKGNILLIEMGSGNVKTVFIRNGVITFSHVHKIGALRVQEILKDIDVQQHKFEKVLREFIRTDVFLLKSEIPHTTIDRFIVVGALVPEILYYTTPKSMEDKVLIKTPELLDVLSKYRELSLHQFSQKLSLSPDQADILLPSLLIFSDFLEGFSPKKVVLSSCKLTDGVILNLGRKYYDFSTHVIASAKFLGKKYHNDDDHSEQVHNLALQIFQKTKSLHKLKKSDLLILQVAALLHDIGRFVNGREHHKHSEYLIANASLPGLTTQQLNMAAVVARNHRRFGVKYGETLKANFTNRDRLKIKKLSAILRLANALDLGHDANRTAIRIKYQSGKNRILFEIYDQRELILEEWGFNQAKVLFESLFSVYCQWMVKDENK